MINRILERFYNIDPQEMMTEEQRNVLNYCTEIVQEVAKEYGKDTNVPSNGWIPYSERLPEKDQRCLVQYNGAMSGFEDYMDVDTYNGEMFEFFGSKYVVAWQPLPEKYQKGEPHE